MGRLRGKVRSLGLHKFLDGPRNDGQHSIRLRSSASQIHDSGKASHARQRGQEAMGFKVQVTVLQIVEDVGRQIDLTPYRFVQATQRLRDTQGSIQAVGQVMNRPPTRSRDLFPLLIQRLLEAIKDRM
jgi:hypothetical protein